MPVGPGVYDDVCTAARLATHARAVIVIVVDGAHGNGFSCQGDIDTLARLPDILDHVVAEMRASVPLN